MPAKFDLALNFDGPRVAPKWHMIAAFAKTTARARTSGCSGLSIAKMASGVPIRGAFVEEIDALEHQILPSSKDKGQSGSGGGSFAQKKRYLQLVRQKGVRRSETVLKFGKDILQDSGAERRLGDEVWNVYEQVCIAALDTHDMATAQKCYLALVRQFPKANFRVGRLKGMLLEAELAYPRADEEYGRLLAEDEGNVNAMKRRVVIAKSKGKIPEAIDLLVKYLDTYMADVDAWLELASLYLSRHLFRQALFCFEELVLAVPHSPVYHRKCAEVCYTMGGADNLRSARKHYAAAVEISDASDVRSLYGLVLTTSALAVAKGSKPGPENSEFNGLATEALRKLYKQRQSPLQELAASTLAVSTA
eukprot:jgi/Mesvir1/5360/Mv15443-RA.1